MDKKDSVIDFSTRESIYERMKWIATDKISEASVFVKRCDLEEALTLVQIAQNALKEMYVEKKDPLVAHILSGVRYVHSLLYATKDSQNAADHASRIGGMLEVITIIMR